MALSADESRQLRAAIQQLLAQKQMAGQSPDANLRMMASAPLEQWDMEALVNNLPNFRDLIQAQDVAETHSLGGMAIAPNILDLFK